MRKRKTTRLTGAVLKEQRTAYSRRNLKLSGVGMGGGVKAHSKMTGVSDGRDARSNPGHGRTSGRLWNDLVWDSGKARPHSAPTTASSFKRAPRLRATGCSRLPTAEKVRGTTAEAWAWLSVCPRTTRWRERFASWLAGWLAQLMLHPLEGNVATM